MKYLLLLSVLLATPVSADDLDQYNVVWTTPSTDAKGSMPMGNGDIGVNLWVEPTGDLLFFISKTDAWDENMRLVKIGRMRVRLDPPLATASGFRQELRLRDGAIDVCTPSAKVRVRVDAIHPVIEVNAQSLDGRPLAATASLELWRTSKQPCDPGYANFAGPAFSWPDTVMKATSKQIGWYHRNAVSPWQENLKLQKLDALARTGTDPILGRTFGAIVRGDRFVAASDTTLKTSVPAAQLSLQVHVLTHAHGTAEEWRSALQRQADGVEASPENDRWTAHCRWWDEFWKRSWIFVRGDAAAEMVTRAYLLQRWVNACGGRGRFPIKFNGSIFVVDHADRRGLDADYRAWGGCYWFQNTRLIYWSMPLAGDLDLMPPLFRMYMNALPARRLATRTYYGHGGAFFPETMTFWGTYNDKNYGADRGGKPDGLTDNGFIRRYWQGGIELTALMLDYFDFTQDTRFRDATLLPFADEVITFFDQHWQRGADGKIRFEPSQALETWWDCKDPMPEVAGLHHIIPRLHHIAGANKWQKTLDSLPPLPMNGERTRVLPAARFAGRHNSENPELYAVFPYSHYGVGKPDLEIARNTFAARVNRLNRCWCQDAIQAACLGLAGDAAKMVSERSGRVAPAFRFPAIWGPNMDWMPDEDHGAGTMSALQRMLLQYDGDRIVILPAWPKSWNVSFRLNAPKNTAIEARVERGEIKGLRVTPQSRRKDVVIMAAH